MRVFFHYLKSYMHIYSELYIGSNFDKGKPFSRKTLLKFDLVQLSCYSRFKYEHQKWLKGHSKTTLTKFWPVLFTYLPTLTLILQTLIVDKN